MSAQHLMPLNSTAFERAVSLSHDRDHVLGAPIEAMRGVKFAVPLPADFAPWLLDEYGLGGVSAYFASIDDAIAAGIPWQRVRGTPEALALALGWIDYEATALEDQNARRRMWHRYQVAMGELPGDETPRLYDAEYLAGLSDPARAIFYRGWHGYNVPALEWSSGRWSQTLWGDDSGVRIDDGSVKWSHGKEIAGAIEVGADGIAALDLLFSGNWGNAPWGAPGLTWDEIVDRDAFFTFLVLSQPLWAAFFAPDGGLAGCRRPTSVEAVAAVLDGALSFVLRCRTGFGDGAGRQIAGIGVAARTRCVDPARPGKLWLEPDEAAHDPGYSTATATLGVLPVDIELRRTVREHVAITIDIPIEQNFSAGFDDGFF